MTFYFSRISMPLKISIFASSNCKVKSLINLVLKDFESGSKILETEAAVLRMMEKSNVKPKAIDVELTTSKIDGCLMMTFVVKEISLEGLMSLQKVFGNEFKFKVIGKSKSELFLELDAPKASFMNLGRRYSYQEPGQMNSQSQFSNSQSGQQH